MTKTPEKGKDNRWHINRYRVSHSGLASEDLCGRALGWTLRPI
jgi:hypothetical protein